MKGRVVYIDVHVCIRVDLLSVYGDSEEEVEKVRVINAW